MRKKGFETDLSVSILLTVPDTGTQVVWAERYLQSVSDPYKRVFLLNKEQENLSIELVRDVVSQAQYATAAQEARVFVLCGIEKASIPAQNALLKILEEPPPHTGFVLVLTQGMSVLPTIVSRCRLVSFGEEEGGKTPQSTASPQTETTVRDALVAQTFDFLCHPQALSYADLVDLAEKWSKSETLERDLKKILKNLLQTENSLKKREKIPVFAVKKLREALESLGKNGNVKLVLEHCFFTVKEHIHQKLT